MRPGPGPIELPRIAALLIVRLLPVAERDEVLSDLADEYTERRHRHGLLHAQFWCWRQVGSSLPALLRRSWWRGWSGFEPAANAMRPGGSFMEQWIMDVRYAARRLIRRPLYSALAILTLALGIGGTAAVFGIARSVLLDPLPYGDEARIAAFWSPFDWNQQEFAFIRGRVPGFSKVAQYKPYDATLELKDAPSRLVSGVAASTELFDVLAARPALGRTFAPVDDPKGSERVVVLSYGLWQELGGSASVIGQRIRLDGSPRTIVGVMPKGFWFPSPTTRLWISQPLDPEETIGNFALIGRSAAGTDIREMSGPVHQLTRMLGERFKYTAQWDKTRDAWVRPIRDAFVRPLRPALLATVVAMTMILLIACANVAALMSGQVEGRATELAVRSALGANRRRVARQLITEALLLGVASGIVGALLAAASFRLLINGLPLGAWGETAALDWGVFVVAMVVALAAALTVSLVPTISLWRGHLRGAIGTGRTGGIAGPGVRLESSIVVAEVALALLMASGAGVLLRSVSKLYAIDPGIEVSHVGIADFSLPSDLDRQQRARVLAEVVNALRGVPGIQQAAVVQHLPLRGSAWSSGITVEGKPDASATTTYVRLVSRDYFAALGVPLLTGRGFEAGDELLVSSDTVEQPIVINAALAKKYFPGEEPLGRRIDTGLSRGMGRIVGVVGNVAEGDLTDAPAPARYALFNSIDFVPSGQTLVFKSSGNPTLVFEQVRRVVAQVAPRVAIAQMTTMERIFALSVGPVRQVIVLVSLLAALALGLGAVGIYGVISHLVARRRRDWGIRIALGLRPSRVLSGVVRSGARLVVGGIAIGLVAFVALARLLTSLVYGVATSDPLSIGFASLVLLAVGVVAALVPAQRASRTDPGIVLRDP